MDSRRHIVPAYEARYVQASEVTHHGRLPAGYHLAGHDSVERLENKLARQAAEIDGLVGHNKKLAASHAPLRQDLDAAQLEIQKRKEDIRSIRAESDMQIRALLDRIEDIEIDIKAGERFKREFREAESEARSLVAANCDITSHIRNTSQELGKALTDMKKTSEMKADLNSLRQENQIVRKTFEFEKGANMEKVERMQTMEKDLVDFANVVKRLREKVLIAERQAHTPNLPNGFYVTQDPLHPPSLHGRMVYPDKNNRTYYKLGAESAIERRIVHVNGISAIVPGTSSSWRGPYETRHIGR
ncbi:hypothetical protein LIER_12044 [Lithospermum erythrorhizon]|uniref:Uncharacterized protein n=1 Tax=Lithospermum erythrorhizon TaxID=34254 RepID=A0AAV3PUL3_LITER